jgi:hypothetical protein
MSTRCFSGVAAAVLVSVVGSSVAVRACPDGAAEAAFADVLTFRSVEAAFSALAGANEARAERAVAYLAARPAASVPRLMHAVVDPNRLVALASPRAAAEIPVGADARLIDAARQAQRDVGARRALRVLARSGDPRGLRVLIRLARNNFYEKQPGGGRITFGDTAYGGCLPYDYAFGITLINALGESPDREAVVPVLREAVRQGDAGVRAAAQDILARWNVAPEEAA